MSTLLIVYLTGVVINAVLAVIIWRDLTAEKLLVKVKTFILALSVLLSFVTWIYVLLHIILSMRVHIEIKRQRNESDIH